MADDVIKGTTSRWNAINDATAPGVYIEQPDADAYAIRGVPLGVAGFIGYVQRKEERADGTPSNNMPSAANWPVALQSYQEAESALEFPPWGFLRRSLRQFFANGGVYCLVVGLELDRLHTPESLVGETHLDRRSGLVLFDLTDQIEIMVAPDLYVAPPGMTPLDLEGVLAAQWTLLDFCGGQGIIPSRGGYFALLDAPPGLNERQVIRYVRYLREHPRAAYGALYYPWLEMVNEAGDLVRVPPSAAIAGLCSRLSGPPNSKRLGRVSSSFGPHLSPANHSLAHVVRGDSLLRRSDSTRLLGEGINSIIHWPGRGMVVWGARTLAISSRVDHICVRRTLSYVGRSVFYGTQWAIFEPNSAMLWMQIRLQIELFLETLWDSGLLVGESMDQAFYVQCDEETNSPLDTEEGRIHATLHIRPARSTEVIVIRISHTSAQAGDQP